MKQLAVIVGAGDCIGAEIAKKFAAEGFTIFQGRRQGEKLEPLIKPADRMAFGGTSDASKEDEVKLMADADAHAPLEVCLFNIGPNANFPILDTTKRVFRKVWEVACYAGFLAGREVARRTAARRKGKAGPTASICGGSGFTAFSSAKFGPVPLPERWQESSVARTFMRRIW